MYEPLRGKKITNKINTYIHDSPKGPKFKGQRVWYTFKEKDVKSAVEFYKKYRVSTERIKKNYQLGGIYNVDLWYNYPELVKQYLKQDIPYNEWLFDFCFGDVIDE